MVGADPLAPKLRKSLQFSHRFPGDSDMYWQGTANSFREKFFDERSQQARFSALLQ